MLISLKLPKIADTSCIYTVNRVYCTESRLLRRGDRILDLKVDMQSSLLHDCPAINFYRFVAQEELWLRNLSISSGQILESDSLIAVLSTEENEEISMPPVFQRQMRVACAAISHDVEWYDLD
ncbi:hypothetical protein G6677_05825 [Polynucleobacter paneuropaeus]|nr:hypothetical protein [Polynucleobacter paneuropaeus]